MVEGLFNEPSYLATRRALDASVVRHEALSTNVANVETPNFRRVDLAPGFRSALGDALRRGDRPALSALRPSLTADARARARRPDGNTVNLTDELLAMQDNSLQHAAYSQMLTGRFARLRMAITGHA